MLVVETIARIRRDHLVRGVPIKTIARDLRVSKNTVRKVVRGDETSYSYERKIQPMPKLGPWVDELERQLEANEKKARRDRLSLLRIHEDLASLGYEGGYDAVRRYARVWWRRHRLLSSSEAYVPLIFDPGEAYQFDWSHEYAVLSGTTTRVKAAHMRLCHSRMQLVQIFPRESQEMVFEVHERAFRFFGGVCRRGIYDNMKTAVSTVFVGKKWDYNRRFQEMCTHHLVEPVACTPGASLGHLAHRAGADPSAEHRGERRRNLAGRQPEHEAGQDHAVDVAGSTGVGAHDSQGAETPCARYRKFDVAKLGHEMTAVRAVAPVALVQRCHLGKMAIDPGRHAFLRNVLERRARRASVILAPFDPFGLHDLHHPKRTW